MVSQPDGFGEWVRTLAAEITGDPLWQQRAYQLALYMTHVAWDDASRLGHDPRTRRMADQLLHAVGSIGANIAEGFSRGTGADRGRFYEYALGSARESRHWYCASVWALGQDVVLARLATLTDIVRLLTAYLPDMRT
ncbi:MAG TPA: four helix bundle protein, partial [Gemmatimonadaceae bacterium]|nr:four helix bundle protein [Gemmatimonadaceae bacterium]